MSTTLSEAPVVTVVDVPVLVSVPAVPPQPPITDAAAATPMHPASAWQIVSFNELCVGPVGGSPWPAEHPSVERGPGPAKRPAQDLTQRESRAAQLRARPDQASIAFQKVSRPSMILYTP